MTDLKYSILENLYHTEYRKMDHTALMNLYLRQHLLNEAKQAVKDLIQDEFVIKDQSDVVHLTKPGRQMYESSKEEREKNKKLEKSQRKAQIVAIISNVITLISIIIALIEIF